MTEGFDRSSLGKRTRSMLAVDLRRMLTTPLIYILVGICLVMPVVILVMTTMMDGTVSVDPQTGKETVVEGFDNVWQIIGSTSSSTSGGTDAEAGAGMGMSLTSMCNINMLYFALAVLVSLFVSEDFSSGYAKNLFTVRPDKRDYVISKTLVCTLGGAAMIVAFFIGSMLGGAVSGLPFEMVGFGVGNLLLCLLSKILLVAVFVPIYLALSTAGRGRAWLSMLLSLAVGMLLFMMIPMLTPLDATLMNPLLCGLGGIIFCTGLGALSSLVLNKVSLV